MVIWLLGKLLNFIEKCNVSIDLRKNENDFVVNFFITCSTIDS